MVAAKATSVFCRVCGAVPKQFCKTSSPCEANSHDSRWRTAQLLRIEILEEAAQEVVEVGLCTSECPDNCQHEIAVRDLAKILVKE